MSSFTVGVTIQMIDRFSSGMGMISRSLITSQKHADAFHARMKQMAITMQSMQALKGIGQGMFEFGAGSLAAVIEPAKEYHHVINQMNMAGLSQIEIAKNIKQAWKSSADMPMFSPTDNLKGLMDMKNFFIDTKMQMTEARELLPSFMQSRAILQANSKAGGFNSEEQLYAQAKTLEMIGAVNDPKMFAHHQDMMNRVMVASGGRVTPQHFMGAFKYMRFMKSLTNDDFNYKVLPELIMEMSAGKGAGQGGGPGAMIAAIGRLGVQGIMSKATAANMDRLGLLKDPVYKTSTTGTIVKGHGGLAHSSELAANPQAWVMKYMVPALVKHNPELKGWETNHEKQVNMMLRMIQVVKGNQMAGAGIQELFQKNPTYKRFGIALDHVPNSAELYKQAQKDPANADHAFEESLNTLKISIGKNIMPVIVPAIYSFAQAINQVGQFFNAHPTIAKGIVALLAGIAVAGAWLAATATVVGSFAIIGATALALGVTVTGLAVTFASTMAATVLVIGVVGGLVMAVLNWGRVSKALVRVLNQGIAVFLSVKVAFLQMLSGMIGGIASAAGAINGLVSGLTFGALKLPMGQINMAAGYSQAALQAGIKSTEADIAKYKKAGSNLAPAMGQFGPKPAAASQSNNKTTNHNTFNIHGNDPHAIGKAVEKALDKVGRAAPKVFTKGGGASNSYAH